MKELFQHITHQDKAEVMVKKQQEKQTVLTGTIAPKLGHKVWEINQQTGEAIEAQYKQTAFDYTVAIRGDFSKKRELVTKEGCIYIPALNAGNALKKYQQNSNQSAYYKKEPLLNL